MIKSWTGIPPKPVGNSSFTINRYLSGLILAGILGMVFGSAPTVLASKMIGGRGITGQEIPFLTHTEIWPKQRTLETPSERLERLDLKMLEEHIPEVAVLPTPEIKYKNVEKVVQPTDKTILKSVKEKNSKPTSPKQVFRESGPVSSPAPLNPTLKKEIPLPIHTDGLLVRIRKDSSRIYIDKEFVFGDLTWGFRNATDEGVEFVVTNSDTSTRTYYLPQAIVEGNDSLLEGSVVSPGQTVFGAIPLSYLKNKKEITITLQAIGAGEKKVKVKLPW